MNNKTDIEEDIKRLNKFCEYEDSVVLVDGALTEYQQAIENILADRERLEKENKKMQVEIAEQVYFGSMPTEEMKQLQAKANKYDSLVEKINNRLEYAENLLKETAKGNLQRYTPSELIFMMKIYEELLDTEK